MPYLNHQQLAQVHEALKSGRDFFGGADTEQLDEALKLMDAAVQSVAPSPVRDIAESIYGSKDIEVDDEGVGTAPAENGTWVQAWVFVPQADIAITEGGPDEEGSEA